MNLLVLGANGMLGRAIFKYFDAGGNTKVFGTVRDLKKTEYASSKFKEKIFEISNMFDRDRFDEVLSTTEAADDAIAELEAEIMKKYSGS